MNNEIFYRINIIYNEGKTKTGKKFKVPHTYDFGYDLTVQLNGGIGGAIEWDDERKVYYLVYDARKAMIKMHEKGYMVLHITDEF